MLDPKKHLTAFVDAFVSNARKDRWHYLFEKNSHRTCLNSHKLLTALDTRYIVRDDGLNTIKSHNVKGVFYRIGRGDPEVDDLRHILEDDPYCDAIFSIVPGKLAIFFFHEIETYVLNRSD